MVLGIIIAMSNVTSDEPDDLKVFSTSNTKSDLDSGKWNEIRPGGATRCSRGDAFGFFVKKGDNSKLILEFQGGGVCWGEHTSTPL